MDKSVKFRIELETKGEKALHTLSMDAKDFGDAVRSVVDEVKKSSEELERMSSKGISFMATLEAIESVRKAVADLSSDFNSFDKGMRAVNTMAGLNADGLDEMKDKVEEIANVVPLAKDELANGLYQVISNGVPEDNWISFLEQSAKSSVGGIADLGETVTVTSTVIKNYGLAWSAAGDIQDKIQLTAKNGVTSFEQLAQALPRVTGNAATLGVSVDELLASFATLTGVSGNTAEVSTQLAAIFTALVKPSSEAATMAEEMGIKFDAAAIQASGGMQNFLTQLSTDIRSYAQANGVLEQEIYGKLFGSAEAMRALIPLTGELADTFEKNVDAMAGSAGTMDQAFETMAGSAESQMQLMKNQFTTLTDFAGKVASAAQPFVEILAVSAQAIYSLSMVSGVLKKTSASVMALRTAMSRCVVAQKAMAIHTNIVAAAQRMLSLCSATAASSTLALNIAVMSLYATLTCGISYVVSSLASLFDSMGNGAENAAEKTNILKDSEDAYVQESARIKSEIDAEVKKLRELMKSKQDACNVVTALNAKYGEEFGCHKTAAEWYDILTTKSRDYVKQIGLEAQARVLAQQLAEKQIALDQNYGKRRELWSTGKAGHTTPRANIVDKETGSVIGVTGGDFVESNAYKGLKQEGRELIADIKEIEDALGIVDKKLKGLHSTTQSVVAATDWQKVSYSKLGNLIDEQKKKVESLAGVNNAEAKAEAKKLEMMQKRYDALGKKYGLSKSNKNENIYDGKKLIENAETYKELGNNIKYYQEKLEKTSKTETATISLYKEKIQLLKRQQEEIDSVGKSYAEQLKAQLDYARKEFEDAVTVDAKVSAQAKIDDIQRKIDRETKGELTIEATVEPTYITKGSTDDMRRSYENAQHSANRIQTDLEIGIIGKEEAEKKINELNKKIVSLGLKPIELEIETNTQKLQKELDDARKEFENAVTVDAKVKAQAKIDEIQREIDRETKGELTIEATVEPAYITKGSIDDVRRSYENAQSRANRIQTDLEIGLIGKKEAEEQIADLNRQLKGMGKNLKPLKIEVDTKKFDRAMKNMKKGWNSIKGISDGVNGITEALKGNGSAWEKTCAIIDGMFTIYEGITGVIELINLLTSASIFHKGAKAAESVATGIATGATILDASQAPAAAAAKIPLIAANKAATNSYLELASAAYFAAHAYIPFAGFGIAAGYAMSAAIMTKAIGAIPFADGGLIYGPTLGLIGEYAGARSNPEVVAPLDKLRSLIQPEGNGLQGKVEFKIRGRRLEGVLEKERRHRMRT